MGFQSARRGRSTCAAEPEACDGGSRQGKGKEAGAAPPGGSRQRHVREHEGYFDDRLAAAGQDQPGRVALALLAGEVDVVLARPAPGPDVVLRRPEAEGLPLVVEQG